MTAAFPFGAALRHRRDLARRELMRAQAAGDRILVLASGQVRDHEGLTGLNTARVTLVDLDLGSVHPEPQIEGSSLTAVENNVTGFLRAAGQSGESWDYIHALGLSDHFSNPVMTLFHHQLCRVLSGHGQALVSSFSPHSPLFAKGGALAEDAGLQVRLRDRAALAQFALSAALVAETWHDPTGVITYSRVRHNAFGRIVCPPPPRRGGANSNSGGAGRTRR